MCGRLGPSLFLKYADENKEECEREKKIQSGLMILNGVSSSSISILRKCIQTNIC